MNAEDRAAVKGGLTDAQFDALLRAIRETVRAEIRAEFEARRLLNPPRKLSLEERMTRIERLEAKNPAVRPIAVQMD